MKQKTFPYVESKMEFQGNVCSQCRICSESGTADFCWEKFQEDRDKFYSQFLWKVMLLRGKTRNHPFRTEQRTKFLRLQKNFKGFFCGNEDKDDQWETGACVLSDLCKGKRIAECFSRFDDQTVGMDEKMEEPLTMMTGQGHPLDELDESGCGDGINLLSGGWDGPHDAAWERHIASVREAVGSAASVTGAVDESKIKKPPATRKRIYGANTKIDTEPAIITTESKAFLKAVEGILENRYPKQRRNRKVPKRTRKSAKAKTNNAKSKVSSSTKSR